MVRVPVRRGVSICGEGMFGGYACWGVQCVGCETGAVVISGTECTLLAVPVDDRRGWLRIWILSLGDDAPPVAEVSLIDSACSTKYGLSEAALVFFWDTQVTDAAPR